VESFWAKGTTLGEVSLDAGQRATILRAQQADMGTRQMVSLPVEEGFSHRLATHRTEQR
jgi:hypothetical protein